MPDVEPGKHPQGKQRILDRPDPPGEKENEVVFVQLESPTPPPTPALSARAPCLRPAS